MGKGKKGKKGNAGKGMKGTFVRSMDMPEHIKDDVLTCFNEALSLFTTEIELAAFVKKEFDKKYGPTWHCVVGREFGSNITYQLSHFIHVFVNQYGLLLFKT